MSSLIAAHDLRLVMLEIAVKNLFMPCIDDYDKTVMKKTVILFRLLDLDWTKLSPNRTDYFSYRGSNYENENFHGGNSVVFALPEEYFYRAFPETNIDFNVHKEVSEHFQEEDFTNFGLTSVRLDDLLNGIVKDLRERKQLDGYMSRELERTPISRSTSDNYELLDADGEKVIGTIDLYMRISYLGECLVTECHTPENITKGFFAREETDADYRYKLRELSVCELRIGAWGTNASEQGSAETLPSICSIDKAPIERQDDETQTGGEKNLEEEKFLQELGRIQAQLALLREMRGSRKGGGTIGITDKPRKICRPPMPFICPSPCPSARYTYTPPCTYCYNPYQPVPRYCSL